MLTTNLLSSRWDAYEKQKTLIHQDPKVFCPEEIWEFNYLLDNIVAVQPALDPIRVMLAIRQCIRETLAPRPRLMFVQRVISSICERENKWEQIVESNQQDAA